MTVQEIFNTPAVRAVEIEILYALQKEEGRTGDDAIRTMVHHLLLVRKQILNSMFVMDEQYKQLLSEFNESLKAAICRMRQQVICMHQSALQSGLPGIETNGRLFLGYAYPKLHPVQTMRAKKIWDLLNGSYDNFFPLYEDGAMHIRLIEDREAVSENYCLYLGEEEDNWNEGLDRKLTSDMHLCFGVRNLTEHNAFSWFDLLWVREFSTEITTEFQELAGKDSYPEYDLDWDICDFFD